jgi:hypothetical protein
MLLQCGGGCKGELQQPVAGDIIDRNVTKLAR